MGERLFTDEELTALARSGRERIDAALAAGSDSLTQREFDHVLGLYRRFHDVYHGWTASLFTFLDDRYGHEVASQLMAVGRRLAFAGRTGMNLAAVQSLEEAPSERFAQELANGDADGARAHFRDVERGARDLHDYLRDYVSSALSAIYRDYGVDALAESLRASSEKDWMPWMMEEIESDPRTRLVEWAELLAVGNFSAITIEEHDDRFVLIQDPCGSCGRQHRERYGSGWDLETVVEKHPITYDQGDTTVYRSHIAMMHYIMPVERIGAPWPLIQCSRRKGGHCRISLMKNPRAGVPQSEAHWLD